jgi:hypothetical protein
MAQSPQVGLKVVSTDPLQLSALNNRVAPCAQVRPGVVQGQLGRFFVAPLWTELYVDGARRTGTDSDSPRVSWQSIPVDRWALLHVETDAPLATALTVMGPIVLERPSEQYRPLKGRLAEVRTCKLNTACPTPSPRVDPPAGGGRKRLFWRFNVSSGCWCQHTQLGNRE